MQTQTHAQTTAPPPSIDWGKGAVEYILISDYGDLITIGTYRWYSDTQTYELTSEKVIAGGLPRQAPVFSRMAVN